MDARERFVPQRVGQLTTQLAALDAAPGMGPAQLRSFSRLVSVLYHVEFHDREQVVVDAWERAEEDPGAIETFVAELRSLLARANHIEVSMDELREALERESLMRLRLHVELDEYEELLIYRRGTRRETVEVPRWRGWRTERRTITVESRVVVLAKLKSQRWFDEHGIDAAARGIVAGQVSLKLFQDVPRADIEMLLPSIRVRYRPIDSLLVGVPAVASGVIVVSTKLLPTLGLIVVLAGAWVGVHQERPTLDQAALVALFGGLAGVGGFLVRQWNKLKNRRLNYLKTLTETLYFRTLADGPGVVHLLLDAAEQQEVVEVLLAYRFLLAAPDGLTRESLDAEIERWLREVCRLDIDFDVDDALAKLTDLDLVTAAADRLAARPLPDALARLHRRWDDLVAVDAVGADER
jgi:hypothetical protein